MRKMKTRLTGESEQLRQTRIHKFQKDLKRDWRLWVILLLPMIYVLIFYYGPMYGLQIAFRDYRPVHGITGSKWAGLQWFKKFITNYQFGSIFKNTIALSLYSLLAGFPLPIIFALALNAVQSGKFKKFTQTVSYIPHFISLAVAVSIVNMILSPVNGIYGNTYHLFGGEGYLPALCNKSARFKAAAFT
jgi:ABC-type polysaccharide transport system permease subunit